MDAGIGETMLIGAAMGGGMSALRGGNIAQGALMGGALGGIGGGISSLVGGTGGLFGGAGADVSGQIGQDVLSMQQAGATSTQISQALQDTYGMSEAQAAQTMAQVAATGSTVGGIGMANAAAAAGSGLTAIPSEGGNVYQDAQGNLYDANGSPISQGAQGVGGANAVTPPTGTNAPNPTNPDFMKDPLGWIKEHPLKAAGIGLGGYTLANILSNGSMTKPTYLAPYNPVTAQQMGLNRGLSAAYTPQRSTMYNAAGGGEVPSYAAGGSLNVAPGSVATQGVAPADLSAQNVGITALSNKYGIDPQQLQQGLASLKNVGLAAGGELGSYSDGGQMLRGGGDGMSDSIPANINGKQPARLADGEFVVPADVVSHLGNGSTDAGAKQLYSMMDKVRQARTGRKVQGKQIKAEKYLPK